MHDVGAALDLLRQLAVLERSNQMAVGVRPVINVEEVVIGLNAETEMESKDERIGVFDRRDPSAVVLMDSFNHICHRLIA